MLSASRSVRRKANPERETVLVIDDSQTVHAYVNALLMADYQVKAALTPEKGLELASAEPQPDLILLDIIMPGMNGQEVCRRLKDNPATADIPVIFLTGMRNPEDEEAGLAIGAVDYITKPISGPILKARVKNHLRLKTAADFMKDLNEFLICEVGQRTHELQEAMARLVDHSAQLNTIFDLSPDGYVAFDNTGHIKYATPAFFRMTGFLPEQVIGQDAPAFAAALDGIALESARFPGFAALEKSKRRYLIELTVPGKPVLEVNLRQSETGSVSQILYFRDVTHETEVDRMKSEFLSHAAHELRTPMASIFGYSELMLVQDFAADERKELVGTIHRQSQLMISIINELLDLARIEARRGKDFSFQCVDAHALIKEIVASFMPPEGRAKPLVEPCSNGFWVRADRKKLLQALINVLSNAYKYSPQGGEVAIELVGPDETTGLVGLRVRDSGIGMTPQQLARVCERFYRADTSGQIPGTGLGMSIVKEILELHGGTVQLESKFGKGTAVTLRLPSARPL